MMFKTAKRHHVLAFATLAALSFGTSSAFAQVFCSPSCPPPTPTPTGLVVPTATPGQATRTAGAAATRVFSDFISDYAAPGQFVSGPNPVTASGLPSSVSQYVALDARVSPIVVDRPAPVSPFRIYSTGFGGAQSMSAQQNSAGVNGTYYGGLVGVDYRVNADTLLGVVAGGSNSVFHLNGAGAGGNTAGFNGAVFGVFNFGSYYGQSLTTLSKFSNETTRNVAGAGFAAIEKANFSSFEVRTRAEFGKTINAGPYFGAQNFSVSPFVALEIAQLQTDGYSENNIIGGGNALGVSANGSTYGDVLSFVGARFATSYDLGNGTSLRPIARLAYVHSFSSAPTVTNSFQAIPGSTFVVNGLGVARDSAQAKIGAEMEFLRGTIVFANFEGNFSNVSQIYGGRGGIIVRW